MIGRFIWWARLAAIAVVTATLQVDMQSRRSPQLAAVVPAQLRSHAQTQIVCSALAGQMPRWRCARRSVWFKVARCPRKT
jgi:hypothetical protein